MNNSTAEEQTKIAAFNFRDMLIPSSQQEITSLEVFPLYPLDAISWQIVSPKEARW